MSSKCFAYQIALKTLKERCNYLQNKLESVEEENCNLKLKLSQDLTKKSPSSIHDLAQLHEQIAFLTEQKAQLKHQVQLVTSENRNLWARLSRFTSENENFRGKISNDDNLKCSEGGVSCSENHSDLEVSKIILSPEACRESLEEISLKLNGICKGETQIQFPDVTETNIDNNSIQMENFAFSSLDDNRSILSSLKDHVLKLKQFKQILQNNKNDLTSAITIFKNFQKHNLCSKCGENFSVQTNSNMRNVSNVCNEEKRNNIETSKVHFELDAQGDSSKYPDEICPLCGVTSLCSHDDLLQHIYDHFSNDLGETN